MKHAKIILLALVWVSAAGLTGYAQSSTAQAEMLFRQGKELMGKGRFAEACAAFEASQKLEPAVTTLLNEASCREKNGQLATAWGLFIEAERQSREATDMKAQQLHQVAKEHAAKLEPRLSTLTINVPAENQVGGLEILRNSESIVPGAWNRALPIDGGTYKITARAPGNTDWSSSITISAERDASSVEIPKLTAAVLQPAPVSVSSAASPARTPARTTTESHQSKVLPLALGGGAVGLIGGAVGFGLWSSSAYNASKREKDNAVQESLWKTANTRRHVAIGLGAAGIVCAGAAVWFYLRDGKAESTPTTQANRLILEPVVARDHAGLVLSGGY